MTSANLHKDKVFTRAFNYSFLNSYSLRNTNFFLSEFFECRSKGASIYDILPTNSNA